MRGVDVDLWRDQRVRYVTFGNASKLFDAQTGTVSFELLQDVPGRGTLDGVLVVAKHGPHKHSEQHVIFRLVEFPRLGQPRFGTLHLAKDTHARP